MSFGSVQDKHSQKDTEEVPLISRWKVPSLLLWNRTPFKDYYDLFFKNLLKKAGIISNAGPLPLGNGPVEFWKVCLKSFPGSSRGGLKRFCAIFPEGYQLN